MALSKKRQHFVTHTETKEGTIVTFHEKCCHIQKGDIPTDTVKIIIPNNTSIDWINEGAIPKSVIRRFKKNGLFTEYGEGYYISTEGNPHLMLVDFAHVFRRNKCIIWDPYIHPDCEIIYPSRVTNCASMLRKRSFFEPLTLGYLIKILGKNYKAALTLEDSYSWSISRGKLIDTNGNIVASLKEELDIYCFYYHGGMWWKSKELFPLAYPGALGYRWFKLMKNEIGLRVYISIKRKGEEDPISIGSLDMTASHQIFNFVCNYCRRFDSECG